MNYIRSANMKLKLLLLAALGIILGPLHSVQAQSFLTNGLVAHYPFDGSANDASGNGFHLINNGATYGANNLGYSNSAAVFNAGSSRAPASNGDNNFGGQWMSFGSAKPVNGLTNMTIAMWLRPGAFQAPGFGNSANQWLLYQESVIMLSQNNYGLERFGFAVGNGSFGGWYPGIAVTNATSGFSTNGTWVHCVYTTSPTGQRLFINGTLIQSIPDGVTKVGTNIYSLGLGAYYNGAMENLRIYNRNLSPNEIASLYYSESKKYVQFVKMYTLDFDGLSIGTNYQLQVSSNLLSWSNWGSAFTATTERYTNAVPIQRVDDWSKTFFRLNPQ